MLVLKLATDPQAHLVWGGSAQVSVPWSSAPVVMVSPIGILSHTGESSVTTKELEIGFLHQGSTPWGRLRDKDVLHVHVDGEIQLDRLSRSATTHMPGPDGYYHLGSAYADGASYHYYGGIYPWGTDLQASFSYDLPLGQHWWHGTCVSSTGLVHRADLRYDGDLVWIVETIDPITFVFADGYQESRGVQVVSLNMVQRYGDAANWQYRHRRFQYTSLDDVICPDGAHYSADQVPVDLGRWSQYLTYGNVPYVAASSLLTAPPEGWTWWEDEVTDWATNDLLPIVRQFFVDHPPVYDDQALSLDILEQHRKVRANLYATLFELVALGDMAGAPWSAWSEFLRSINLKGFRLPRDLLGAVKRFLRGRSGTYLGAKYGIMPLASDVTKLWDAGKQLAKLVVEPTRIHARHNEQETASLGSLSSLYTRTVEVSSLPKDFLTAPTYIVQFLHEWGVMPDFEQAWDLLPASFIVDWFFTTQEAIRRMNATYIWTHYYPVSHVISSEKREWLVSFEDLRPDFQGVTGDLVIVHYHRYIEQVLPLSLCRAGVKDGRFNHWLEAIALVVQKLVR